MTSRADQLEQLAALRDRGVLTPEEFEQQKARLLARAELPSEAAPSEPPQHGAADAPRPTQPAKPLKLSPKMIGAAAAGALVIGAIAIFGGSKSTPATSGPGAAGAPAAVTADGATVDPPESTAATAQPSAGALDDATIKQCVYSSVGSNGSDIQWTSISQAGSYAATNAQAATFEVDPGITLYPVRVAYTRTTGSGPSAYIRDAITHYVYYKDRFGKWACTRAKEPEDKNELRGGYAN